MKFQPGGGLWPVVQRELRETARRPLNHWLRLAGALGGVVMLCTVTADLPFNVVGGELFNYIHLLLMGLICGLVPALTADCIARERRDGTLGLLFMTPLTASSIVVGKVLAQLLRALTVWLALMPLLTIPFLCGGVTWIDIASLLSIELCAGMMCMAAGILASSLADSRGLAFILAFLLTGAFVGGSARYENQKMMNSGPRMATWSVAMSGRRGPPVFPIPGGRLRRVPIAAAPIGWASNSSGQARLPSFLPGVSNYVVRTNLNGAVVLVFPPGITNGAPRRPGRSPLRPGTIYGGVLPSTLGYPVSAGFGFFVPTPAPTGFASRHPSPQILLEGFFIAAIILLASIRFAGFCVERSWQDKIPSPRRQGWVRRYCSPIFKNWFARKMRDTKEFNPIAWLQQYSWKARLSKWGLCLLFVVLECAFVDGNDLAGFANVLTALLFILVGAYTFAGVNGFIQEKRSGALELILVSPISVNQIIFGRVWGLWKQFLPSVLVLIGSDLAFHGMVGGVQYYYNGSWSSLNGQYELRDMEIAAIYLTLPVVATCFALTAKNLFVASALTVALVFGPAVIMLFPGLLNAILESMHLHGFLEDVLKALLVLAAFPITVWGAHAYSASMAYHHLERSLGRRSYAY